ncbi:hypothetical protein [Actinocorallia populi]|uniref:hypothetical protein n=1 Tax=Actinocorallia populi TaxID=2079200 RepID=UPI000D08964D|nr:hypothetical protein [Actinocorallia populi]
MQTPPHVQVRAGLVGLLAGGAAGFLLLDAAAALLAVALGRTPARDGEPVALIVAVPAVCAVLGCLVSFRFARRKGGR